MLVGIGEGIVRIDIHNTTRSRRCDDHTACSWYAWLRYTMDVCLVRRRGAAPGVVVGALAPKPRSASEARKLAGGAFDGVH